MKLPPAALTAPTLCPRCDSPAIMTDYCIACTLPLRRCGSCEGVAGPFDRYCGFCGYELVRGERRPVLWRLWLLAALIPLVAGIAFGLSPYSAGLGHSVTALVGASAPTPAPTPAAFDPVLRVGYTAPSGWVAAEQGSSLVINKWPPDAAKVAAAQGNLLAAPLQSTGVVVTRATVSGAVDASSPDAVLAFDLAQLLNPTPAGMKLEVVRPVTLWSAGGRRGAEAVLRVTRADGSVWYLERAYVVGSGGALVRVDAFGPAADWTGGDDRRVEALVRSLRG